MSDNWDFYILEVDDQPASNFVDLALVQTAPITSLPVMAYVSVEMRAPRPDGFSSNDEFEDLIVLGDALETQLTAEAAATYAGRCTTAGNRDFYFYGADPDAFTNAVESAMAGQSAY